MVIALKNTILLMVIAVWSSVTACESQFPLSTTLSCSSNTYLCCLITARTFIRCWRGVKPDGSRDPDSHGLSSTYPEEAGFMSVSVAGATGCALHQNGTVTCWGNGQSDQFVPKNRANIVQVTVAAASSAILYYDGNHESFGSAFYRDRGFECNGNCSRVDAGLGLVTHVLTDGGVRAQFANGRYSWVDDMSMQSSRTNRFLKCTGGYYYNVCCLRQDGRLVCINRDSTVLSSTFDWAYILDEPSNFRFVGVKTNGAAYTIEAAPGASSVTEVLLYGGQPMLAGGTDSIGSGRCMISASPATFGEVICHDEGSMPPPEIAAMGVASPGCVEYPRQVLDIKAVLVTPGAPCSDSDRNAAAAGIDDNAATIHLASSMTFGVWLESVVPLTATSGHVRLFIDIDGSWPAEDPVDRRWDEDELNNTLMELQCSARGSVFNGQPTVPGRHIDVRASQFTQTKPEVWCVGGFTQDELVAVEAKGLAPAGFGATGGARLVAALIEDGSNGTVLAVSSVATRVVPRRRHVHSLNVTSDLSRHGGDGISVSGSCLGSSDIQATMHMEPFEHVSMRMVDAETAIATSAVGFGNGSTARFTWADGSNSATPFNYTVSGRWTDSSLACNPVSGWTCLEPTRTAAGIPVAFQVPMLGSAIPPQGLNQSGTEPLFVELDVPDGVADVASSTTRMWVGPEECTSVIVLAGSVRCLSMPPSAGGPHAIRVQLLGGQLAFGITQVLFRASQLTSISPSFLWPSVEASTTFIIRGDGLGQRPEHVSLVLVGGHDCVNVSWHGSDQVECSVGPVASYGEGNVVVWTGSVASYGGERMLSWQQWPVVAGGIPGEIPVDGGANLTVIGQNFGVNGTNIRDVRVGGTSCLEVVHQSPVQLRCVTPAGVGTGLYIEVETVGGIVARTRFPAVSFEPPSIRGLEPRFAFSDANRFYDFNISGSALGLNDSHVEGAQVGGSACSRVEVVNSRLIRCLGVRAVWSSTSVDMRVAGQTARGLSLFEFLPPPRVYSVQPDTASTTNGTLVQVTGEGLGSSAEELLDVTVGLRSCLSFGYINPYEAWCVTPPGVGREHEVQVHVQHQSVSEGGPSIHYKRPVVMSAAVLRDADAVVGAGRGDVSRWALSDYMFGGETRVDVAFRAEETGTDAVLAAFNQSISTYLEDAAGSDWRSDCGWVETGAWLEEQWASWDAARVNASDTSGSDYLDSWDRLTVCRNASLGGSFQFNGQVRLRVQLAGYLDAINAEDESISGVIDVVGHPTVTRVFLDGVTDGVVPTSGLGSATGRPVKLFGNGFGRSSDDVVQVLVGSGQAVSFEWISSTQVDVALPAGVGAAVPIRVGTRGDALSDAITVRYKAASITRSVPGYVLSGPHEVVLNLTGADLGNGPQDLDSITVGDSPCAVVRWVSSSLVQCLWRQADDHVWANSAEVVQVTVGGQRGVSSVLLQTLGKPWIDRVAPRLVDPGDEMLLVGSNFGREDGDVDRVEVDGIPCSGLQRRTDTAVVCIAPEPRNARQEAAISDVSALANLTVVVVSRTGLRSRSLNISYVAAGTPLVEVPRQVTSWRPVGRGGSMVVRWTYSADDTQDSIAPVQSFDIEMSRVGGAGIDDVMNSTAVRRAVDDMALSTVVQGGQVVYGEEVVAPSTLPLRVRVRAINPTSQSNWSDYSSIVTENCDVDEYLQTQLPIEEQACAPCPEEAYCGGMPAGRVVALPGYWRVPWSSSGLGFVKCEEPEACVGFDPRVLDATLSGDRNVPLDRFVVSDATGVGTNNNVSYIGLPATATGLSRQLVDIMDDLQKQVIAAGLGSTATLKSIGTVSRGLQALSDGGVPEEELPLLNDVLLQGAFPSAIPQDLWPVPGAVEGCSNGYDGTMCSSCQGGFTPADGTKCRRCEDRAVVVVAAVFVCLLLLLVVLGLTFNAVISKGQTTVTMASAKILFSHLQTVAVALRLPFQYPPFVRDLFAAMNSMSSVNTDVLALDCLLTGDTEAEAGDLDDSPRLPLNSRFIARSIVTICIPLMLIIMAAVFWAVWPSIRMVCCWPCARAVQACAAMSSSDAAGSPSSPRSSARRSKHGLLGGPHRALGDSPIAQSAVCSAPRPRSNSLDSAFAARQHATALEPIQPLYPLGRIYKAAPLRTRVHPLSEYKDAVQTRSFGPISSLDAAGSMAPRLTVTNPLALMATASGGHCRPPPDGRIVTSGPNVLHVSGDSSKRSHYPIQGLLVLPNFASRVKAAGTCAPDPIGLLSAGSERYKLRRRNSADQGSNRSLLPGLSNRKPSHGVFRRTPPTGAASDTRNTAISGPSKRPPKRKRYRRRTLGGKSSKLAAGLQNLSSAKDSPRPPGEVSPASASSVMRNLMTDDEVVRISVCDRVLTTAGVVAFLVHMTETYVALSLMTCTSIEHSEEAVSSSASTNGTATGLEAADLSLSCQGVPASQQGSRLLDDLELCCRDGATQAYMFGLGMPALLLYSMGIPLVTGVVLWAHQGELTDPRVATTFGFMRAGYRDEAFWFECVVMLRKALLVCIAVGLAPLGIEVQTYAILGLLFGVALVQAALQPFSSSALNRLELTALVTAFVTFDAGLYLGSPIASSQSKMFVNATVFMANLGFLCAAVSVIIGSRLCGRCQSSSMARQATLVQAQYAAAKRRHERRKTKKELVSGLDSTKVQMAIAGSKAQALMRGDGRQSGFGKASRGLGGRTSGRRRASISSDSSCTSTGSEI